MGFREKVALVCLAVITFQTACIFSMPPIWSKKDSTKIFQKNNINTDDRLFNRGSVLPSVKSKPQTILKSFNFPEVEYSPARLLKPIHPQTILGESSKVKDHSEFLNNFRKEKRRKRKYGNLKMPDEKPIGRINNNKQNYLSQIEAFPQMEFPLTASETWAPSFWNQLSFPLHDPYFDFNRNIYKPENSQNLIQSNLIKNGKYATTTNTKSKGNTKINLTPKNNNTVPISKKYDVLQANDKTFAKMIMPNTTTILKDDNDKSEDTSDNVTKTVKPKRKSKTRKIKIVTKSPNVFRDLIAKKSNISCSVHNNDTTNNCSHKNHNETNNHAISDVINDRKNTEISDLLSDDFDVCFVNHNLDKITNDDSQICVSFDHNKSTEELLSVSDTVKMTQNDDINEILNHTITVKNNTAKPDKSSKIIINDMPIVENQEQIITDIKETVSLLDDFKQNTSDYYSNEHCTKMLSDKHSDKTRKDKSTTTNSDHLENYELLDEVKEIRELNTDSVLCELEHAIVNSKIDGTIDTLIPKIKQAILEAIVESAAFVPSHIPTGFPLSRQNVHYDTNQYDLNDVELININGQQNIESSDVLSFMKGKYSVSNQTIELKMTETLNLTDTKPDSPKSTFSDNFKQENKNEQPDTIITPTSPRKNKTLNQEKFEVLDSKTLLNHPTSDVIISLKQNEKERKGTNFDLTKTKNNITDTVANKQLKALQMSDILIKDLNTNYTNNKDPADISTTAASINSTNYNKMPLVKILLETIESNSDEKSHNSVKIKNIDLSLNDQSVDKISVLDNLETNNEINNAREIDSVNDQDNNVNKEIINIDTVTDIYEVSSFNDVFDDLTFKQDNVTSIITSSDTLKSNNRSDAIDYNDSDSSINTFEQEEQTTPSHGVKYLNDNSNIYIDQSGYLSQSYLNSDLETRIFYADEKEIEPQNQLLDTLEVDKNAYINHDFKDENFASSWLESDNATTNIKLIPDVKQLSESISQVIKSDIISRDQPALSDELSSDEFTDEIINAIIDILYIEDSECNNNISTNNTVNLTDSSPYETINESKNNADILTILNEDKNISNDNFGSELSDLDSTVKKDSFANIILNKHDNNSNASDEIIDERINMQGPLLSTMTEDNQNARDFQDKAPELVSDKETQYEQKQFLENTIGTKETYPNTRPNKDTVAIDITKHLKRSSTEEVIDNEDNITLNDGDLFLEVPSVEKTPSDNKVTDNRITKPMDDELDENYSSNFKATENEENTAIGELLSNNGDVEVR